MPLWDKMISGAKERRQQAILIFLTVLIFTAGSLSYTVWDTTAGIGAMARSVITVLFVQIAYWLINITVLYLADVLYYKKQYISLTEL